MSDGRARTRTGPSAEKTVFLHIGAPKTGTSYLQARFTANRAALAADGLLWVFPWGKQVAAVRDVRALHRGGRLRARGPWMTMVGEARAWPGPCVLVSMEWLTHTKEHQVRALVDSLAPARVEVILTARDVVRVLPATWQESTQNGRSWEWHDYVRAVTDPTGSRHRGAVAFWANHDLPRLLERWSRHVPVDRIHLVTVPSAAGDPQLLWTRFCSVLGLDAHRLAETGRSNPSLGVVSATVLRRLNATAKGRLSDEHFQRLVKRVLAKQVLARRRSLEDTIAVPDRAQELLAARASEMVSVVRALPVDVVGDLDELLPTKLSGGRDPAEVTDAEMLETAVEGLVGLVGYAADRERRLRRQASSRSPTRHAHNGSGGPLGASLFRSIRSRVARR